MATINYLIEFSILYTFCGIIYCLLRKRTKPSFLRMFILGSLGISLMIPLLPNFGSSIELFGVTLPEVVITGDANAVITPQGSRNHQPIPFTTIAWVLYLIVSTGLLIRLLNSIRKIYQAISNQSRETINGSNIILSDVIHQPCSFFNNILIPADHTFTESEMAVILKHESYHISYGHSVDKLLFEIALVILWWHPVTYLFRTQLSLVHEYEVDESMLKSIQPKTYQNILLQLVLNPSGLRISNQFSSHIKQRITMMYSQKTQLSLPSMIALVAIVMGGLISIHACSINETTDLNPPAPPAPPSASEIPPAPPAPPAPPKIDSDISYLHETIDTVIMYDYGTYEESVSIVRSSELIYKTPETMPRFPGCDGHSGEALEACSQQKLLEYVYKNIEYPSSAREKGIQGMVVMKFVVDETGHMFNQEFMKSPDPSFETSVATMMNKMASEITWIPGTHEGSKVNTEFILPVSFKLQ